MCKSDELKKSIDAEIQLCDDFLEKAKDVAEIVPSVQERKEEAEAKVSAIENIPEDVLNEIAPQLLKFQIKDENNLAKVLPFIPGIDVVYTRAVLNTGSTSSDSEIIASIVRSQPVAPKWASDFMKPFTDLSEKQDRVARIRKFCSGLQPYIGDLVDLAVETTVNAKGGGTDVDHACMRLRDVLEKVWGELCDLTRKNLPRGDRSRRLSHGTAAHRRQVAENLAYSEELTHELDDLLSSISKLHSDLSQGSKDPFNNDIDYLIEVYSRWTLHLFNLSRMIGLD